jgi:protein SCO1
VEVAPFRAKMRAPALDRNATTAPDAPLATSQEQTQAQPMTRIQRFVALGMVGLLCAFGAALFLLGTSGGPRYVRATSPPVIGGPFTLTTPDGTTVTEQAYRGKILVVYFGYTLCPDICPTTLGEISDALEKLGPDADQIQPLFITLDPRRDTPTALGAYVKNFGSRIIGLTGTAEQIAAVAKEYKVYYAPHRTEDAPDGYLIDHTADVYVMDRDGHFVKSFDATSLPGQLAKCLTNLLPDKASRRSIC